MWSEVQVWAEQDARARDTTYRLLRLRDARVSASKLLLAATCAIGEGGRWLQHPLRAEVTSDLIRRRCVCQPSGCSRLHVARGKQRMREVHVRC